MQKTDQLILLLGLAVLGTTSMAGSFAEFDQKAKAGERLTVSFFGASLTWGANATDHARTSYRARIAEKLEQKYPDARFTFVDGAIGGTNSQLGVFRLQRDCLRYDPDLVFLDFSANDDVGKAQPELLASYESLVRRVIKDGNCPMVIVVFPFKWNATPGTAKDMKGRRAHLKIADAYDVPVGDAILHIQNLVAKDKDLPEKIWNIDSIHPGDYGYQIFADAAWQGFMQGLEKKMVCQAPPEMLHADTYMSWSRNRISQMKPLPKGWDVGYVSRISAWYDGLMSRWLDDVVIAKSMTVTKDKETKEVTKTKLDVEPIKLKFKAATVLVFGEETVKSGKYEAFLDGKQITHSHRYKTVDYWDLNSTKMGGGRQHVAVIATGLDTDKVHTLEIRPRFDGEAPQELRLESICLAGGDAKIVKK